MPLILREELQSKRGLQDWIGKVGQVLGRKPGTGIEIGTYRGESAIVLSAKCDHLICVDSYIPFTQVKNLGNLLKARLYFLKVLEKRTNISFLHMSSEKASKILTGKFDFIYIDAAHDYESVKQDIELWKDKALVLGGHDYTDPEFRGLRKAVRELAGDKEIITFADTSWMYV